MSHLRPTPRSSPTSAGPDARRFGGCAGLLAWSGHVLLHADLIRFFALTWLMVFGAARILVHLDEVLQDEAPDTDHGSRPRGRGDL